MKYKTGDMISVVGTGSRWIILQRDDKSTLSFFIASENRDERSFLIAKSSTFDIEGDSWIRLVP